MKTINKIFQKVENKENIFKKSKKLGNFQKIRKSIIVKIGKSDEQKLWQLDNDKKEDNFFKK